MAILYPGIDLAKNVFALHSVDEAGKPALVRPSVPRVKLLELVAALPPCVIGMAACSGVHHWARLFQQFGHTVRLMAPTFANPAGARSCLLSSLHWRAARAWASICLTLGKPL